MITAYPNRIYSENVVGFRSPGHMIETIFFRAREEFGPEFIKKIPKEKLLELSSVITDFVTDLIVIDDLNKTAIKTEIQTETLKLTLIKERSSLIARIYYHNMLKKIEFPIHGYSISSNEIYGSHSGPLKRRKYEILTPEKARNIEIEDENKKAEAKLVEFDQRRIQSKL